MLRRNQSTFAHHKPDVQRLPEVVSAISFPERLDAKLQRMRLSDEDAATLQREPELVRTALTAAMATTSLHTESRIAAYGAYGYYTIGPCGEELTAALALALLPSDPAALHYRHLGALVARQLQRGVVLDDVMLDRARGYTTATTDPVTGGVHCSLGADPQFDFLVTSTLASQGPQAVGRALAIAHLPQAKWPSDAISFVSCGDGSINNSEWLSAVNASEYIQHRRRACPVLFAISDNGMSISLKGFGWTERWAEQRLGMKLVRADGSSLPEVLRASHQAADYVRTSRAPATLLMSNLPRRFGHAATDRQSAYLTAAQIDEHTQRDPVVDAIAACILSGVVPSAAHAVDDFRRICELAAAAFATARAESREMSEACLVARCAAPRPPRPARRQDEATAAHSQSTGATAAATAGQGKATAEMRTLMTRGLHELLQTNERVLYVGEDVEHGGYYRVSEGLKASFGRRRIFDWPPDEASLVGAGIGMAQAGHVPIVEIPYAAYLSCGYNQFVEACFLHWLSDGKQPNGMLFRMQGFDEGIFGGHFHTANAPPVFGIPGLDVLCFSNGRDWVRGMRACVRYAEAGGVSMLLDSTALLSRKHVSAAARDGEWEFAYPEALPDGDEELQVDDVLLYPGGTSPALALTVSADDGGEGVGGQGRQGGEEGGVGGAGVAGVPLRVRASELGRGGRGEGGSQGQPSGARLAVATYGNGVPHALQAVREGRFSCDIIDSPLLSRCPSALPALLRSRGYDGLLLVDVCREGGGPMAHVATSLHSASALPPKWRLLAANPSYNPLGRTLTFVSAAKIRAALAELAADVGLPHDGNGDG